MQGTLPFLGVSEASIPAIEAHTRELLDALNTHFESSRFLLGDAMSLADCGLMGPFYGHLYRDAVPEKLLYETAFHVCAWIERMCRPPLDQGGWLEGDALAPSLREVLKRMADGVPMLVESVRGIDAFLAEPRDGEPDLRKPVGVADAAYRDTRIQPALRPYTLWMVQRPLDAYRALAAEQRAEVDAALSGTGWEALLALEPRHRVTKRDHLLVVES